jgi:hypothetical protein
VTRIDVLLVLGPGSGLSEEPAIRMQAGHACERCFTETLIATSKDSLVTAHIACGLKGSLQRFGEFL